jgi:2-polyprenyl-3-methyl-5-hydroxy-6-metoxy-1,4-benzoquinol methylase
LNWQSFQIAASGTHHIDATGNAVYNERFDNVLKFHAPGLAPVTHNGIAWHVFPNGTAAYERRFARTFGFYENRAAVIAQSGGADSADSATWFHITPDGTDAYARRHAWCGNFQEGLCAVCDKSDATIDAIYYHIKPDGTPACPTRWKYAGDFRDGNAVVQTENGLHTHINVTGDFIHRRWFLDLDVFHKGFARARDADGWMHIDATGAAIYIRRFAAVEPFYNGQARVECFDGSLEVISENGATLVKLRPPRQSDFAALSADMVGFWKTKTIATAVKLGVFEALPAPLEEIAACCKLKQDGAKRLLRALGELQLVLRENEVWRMTPRGEFLRLRHPLTLSGAALDYAGRFSEMWRQLPAAISENSTWVPPAIFQDISADKNECETHHRALSSYARHDYEKIPAALELDGNETIVDAGCGLGFLSRHLHEQFPNTKITGLDRTEVVEQANVIHRETAGVNFVSGDIFKPWNITADVVILARVLHDWDDMNAEKILANARAAISQNGRLFIIEMLLSENNFSGALCDLHLLTVTGGKERTENEYKRLLAASKFQFTKTIQLSTLPAILEARAA